MAMSNKQLMEIWRTKLANILQNGVSTGKDGVVVDAGAAYFNVALAYLKDVGAVSPDDKKNDIPAKLLGVALPFSTEEELEEFDSDARH